MQGGCLIGGSWMEVQLLYYLIFYNQLFGYFIFANHFKSLGSFLHSLVAIIPCHASTVYIIP